MEGQVVDALRAASTDDYVGRRSTAELIQGEFHKFDPGYDEKREPLKAAFKKLSNDLDRLQDAGQTMVCSEQIRQEAKWLLNYRAEWPRLERRLAELKASLSRLAQGAPVQGDDGSWAGCTEEFYRKLEPTIDELQSRALSPARVKPLTFLHRLNDPKRLLGYLWELQISDIARTGRNDRDELGAVESALTQLFFKDDLRAVLEDERLGFPIDTELENAYTDFLRQTQHPRTGYWGPWYRADGQLFMVQDLSFTFHQVTFRAGNVENWERIAETTLSIKERTYPNGWKPNNGAKFSNHHNYDVVQIFFYGWPHMSRRLKCDARAAIREMLDWCLIESIRDNVFVGDERFEALYFGVRFLDRVGYWDGAKRFWSREGLSLPDGAPNPNDLAPLLLGALDHLQERSERADTVRAILQAAACVGAARQQAALSRDRSRVPMPRGT
jgi:hypothetical protein